MGRRRVMVIGLDCAEPSLVFDRYAHVMPNVRRLMRRGCWGPLRSTIPPITVPAWTCMVSGSDPGALGIYGFRNRKGRDTYDMTFATSASVKVQRVWDILGALGLRSTVLFVPQTYPVSKVHGSMVSCFLTPGADSEYAWPAELKTEIASRFGDYIVDVPDFRTDDKDRLLQDIYGMTRQHFAIARHMLAKNDWDFFMMVEMGVDRFHHAFWKYIAEDHPKFERTRFFESGSDYYGYVDREIGTLLEYADDDTAVLVVSDHGARTMKGGICVNEWLVRNGYLALRSIPEKPMPLGKVGIDYAKTKAWGEGGYYGRIFMNVKGREPQGVIPPEDYEAERDLLKRKLEAIGDENGKPIGTVVWKPEDAYPAANGTPPDLIAIFGNLDWRSVGSVGLDAIHTFENDTGPDDANHAWDGILVMAGHGIEAKGAIEGAQVRDVARTVMRLFDLDPPEEMGGKALV